MADFASPDAMLAYIREHKLVVLEHQLVQHPDMARLHPNSVNTMRIVTDNVNGNVTIAYIIVKMGTGGSVCDNSGQGGILARVDVDTGRISTPATDDYFHVYDTHPDTGIPLVGYQLPMVPEAIAMAKEAAQVFPQVGHVGWDMAVTPDGKVVPCQSWLSDEPLGDLLHDDWADIWNSPRCAAIRAESAKLEHICQLKGKEAAE